MIPPPSENREQPCAAGPRVCAPDNSHTSLALGQQRLQEQINALNQRLRLLQNPSYRPALTELARGNEAKQWQAFSQQVRAAEAALATLQQQASALGGAASTKLKQFLKQATATLQDIPQQFLTAKAQAYARAVQAVEQAMKQGQALPYGTHAQAYKTLGNFAQWYSEQAALNQFSRESRAGFEGRVVKHLGGAIANSPAGQSDSPPRTNEEFERRVRPLLNPQERSEWEQYARNNPDIVIIIREAAHDASEGDMEEAVRALLRGAAGQDVAARLRAGGTSSGQIPPSGRTLTAIAAGGAPQDPHLTDSQQLARQEYAAAMKNNYDLMWRTLVAERLQNGTQIVSLAREQGIPLHVVLERLGNPEQLLQDLSEGRLQQSAGSSASGSPYQRFIEKLEADIQARLPMFSPRGGNMPTQLWRDITPRWQELSAEALAKKWQQDGQNFWRHYDWVQSLPRPTSPIVESTTLVPLSELTAPQTRQLESYIRTLLAATRRINRNRDLNVLPTRGRDATVKEGEAFVEEIRRTAGPVAAAAFKLGALGRGPRILWALAKGRGFERQEIVTERDRQLLEGSRALQSNQTVRSRIETYLTLQRRAMQEALTEIQQNTRLANEMQQKLAESGLSEDFTVVDVMRAYLLYQGDTLEQVVQAFKLEQGTGGKAVAAEQTIRIKAALASLKAGHLWPVDRRLVQIFAPEYVPR